MKTIIRILILIFLLTISSGCTAVNRLFSRPTQTPTVTQTPTQTQTPLPTLTPTPPPSVAVVNGVYVWQEDFDTMVANLRAAYQEISNIQKADSDLEKEALEKLIDETLFEAVAYQNGFTFSEDEMNDRIHKLTNSVSGSEALGVWMNANHYTESGLRRSLKREIAAAWMREKIFEQALNQVEQIHAYQILTKTHAEANQYKAKLDLGINFLQVAADSDRLTGGNLDWIARGVLVYPELETALFSLQPGTYTNIIETPVGFHILYSAERSTDRVLTLQTRQILEQNALRNWLEDRKLQRPLR